MSRHASLDDLASFIEGVLKPRKTGKIAAHLAGCSLCTGHVQDLQQVPARLANLAFPAMPDELSVRIEAAISTESTVRVTTPGSVSGEAGRRDLPERSRPTRQRWRMPGFSSPLAGSLAAVGAAVIIAGGGYEIASHAGGTNATSSGSSSASSAHAGQPPAAASGAERTAIHAVSGPNVQFRAHGHTQTTPSVRTSTDFVPARLQAQVLAALNYVRASALKSAQGLSGASASPQATSTAGGATALSGCVSNVAAGRNVLLVDIARYNGSPATIIVVGTPPNGPGTIYVAGADCSASNTHILAQQQLPVRAP